VKKRSTEIPVRSGPKLLNILDIPHVAFVSNVTARKEDSVEVESESWGATYVKSMTTPGLITVTKDVNDPRLPSFKDKQRARKAEITNWSVEDISINPDNLGVRGSPTRVANMEVPPPDKRESLLLREDPGNAVNQLLEKLDLGREK